MIFKKFQLTLSKRRVTCNGGSNPFHNEISIHTLQVEGDFLGPCIQVHRPISIHTLQAEGDAKAAESEKDLNISIHTLQAEGDGFSYVCKFLAGQFQSTPSKRRVTISSQRNSSMHSISIHTLQAEGDCLLHRFPDFLDNFNPHPPSGG